MKNLRLIDTTENERIFNSSKDLSSAYVTLTVENKNLTYTIPNSLEHLGTIGDMVNLKSLVVPEHVKFFSTVSFNNTPKLETLTLKSKTKVYDFIMALTRYQSLQSIYVQKNLLETYKTSKGWKDIADKIKPIED